MPSFDELFDSESFRKNGYRIVDQLTNYLYDSSQEHRIVRPYHTPEDEYEFWEQYQPASVEDMNGTLITRAIALHHPKYIGHQVSSPLPEAALIGLSSELLNNGMGIFEMGAAGVAMEHWVINQLSELIGWNARFNGFLTSGGTLANLTALLAARAYAERDLQTDSPKWTVLVSEQAHFCIERAVTTMGLGSQGIVMIKTDENFQVDLKDLKQKYDDTIAGGRQVMAVVGCACSTSTGIYDDLSSLANFCNKHRLWLHIDGAHGGAVIYSKKYKHLFFGAEKAHSIVIDMHKMMLTPALATAVIFHDGSDSYQSFRQKADYLFDENQLDPHNLAKRTYETTKYMMSAKVYFILKCYGGQLIEQYIDRQHDLTRAFYEILEKDPDFECAHQPMSNILCFRYICEEPHKLNDLNSAIRTSMLHEGRFYIVSTVLHGRYYLRVTIMNPLTGIKDLEELVQVIKAKANQLRYDA